MTDVDLWPRRDPFALFVVNLSIARPLITHCSDFYVHRSAFKLEGLMSKRPSQLVRLQAVWGGGACAAALARALWTSHPMAAEAGLLPPPPQCRTSTFASLKCWVGWTEGKLVSKFAVFWGSVKWKSHLLELKWNLLNWTFDLLSNETFYLLYFLLSFEFK